MLRVLALLMIVAAMFRPAMGQQAEPREGVWVGTALIDQVGFVEIRKGPEFPAPVGSPQGTEKPHISETTYSSSYLRRETKEGVTTESRSFEAVADRFNSIYLDGPNYTKNDISVIDLESRSFLESGADYEVRSSRSVRIIDGGSGYHQPPDVHFEGGGGTAEAGVVRISGGVAKVNLPDRPDLQFFSPPRIAFVGDGEGAAAKAILGSDGRLLEIVVTNPGKGYTRPPRGFIKAPGRSIDVETVLSASVTFVAIDSARGFEKTPPRVVFSGGGGSGARAEVYVDKYRNLVGPAVVRIFRPAERVDARKDPSRPNETVVSEPDLPPIGERLEISATRRYPAAPGTPDGTVTHYASHAQRTITVNGISHVETRTSHRDDMNATPAPFPVRLIFHHSPENGTRLLQKVFLGDGAQWQAASLDEETIKDMVVPDDRSGRPLIRRVSSSSFPLDANFEGRGNFGSTIRFYVRLGHDENSNPFLHRYHPDHDNWDDRYERRLEEGDESFLVFRTVKIVTDKPEEGEVSPAGSDDDVLTGLYSEEISGLRNETISLSGRFQLHRVSTAATLLEPIGHAQ